MNLTIDLGNQSAKWAVFEKENCLTFGISDEMPNIALENIVNQYSPDKAIVSSVSNKEETWRNALEKFSFPTLWLNSGTPLPIKNDYLTPNTLGPDRLAAAVGAATLLPGKNLLVIDMGTCITYDFVTAEGHYKGGNISPGLYMRMVTMHQHTAHLPVPKEDAEWPPITGNNTEGALRGGVLWGIKAETETYYTVLKKHYGSIITILTGGDSHIFEHHLDTLPLRRDVLLVEKGLNAILEYNKNEY